MFLKKKKKKKKKEKKKEYTKELEMIKETEWSKLYGNQRFESLHNRLNSFNLSANNLLLLLGSTLEGLMTNNSKQTFF